MKKMLKITGIVLASLVLIFGIFALINQIGEKQMNEYIDTFSAVEVEDALTPVLEEGEYFFTTDRDFKVMQLTDVHLGGGFLSRNEDKKAINAIAAMVQKEKPDLVIVTGDVSFAVPYISGTINNAIAHRMFMRLMERLGVSWTIVFGNHDSEAYNYYNRVAVSKMYDDESLAHCLFLPDGDLSGEGNHVINVKNSLGMITESFYMIDTHSYTDQDPLGIKWDYDYVKEDQIAWYAGKVEAHKSSNAAIYETLTEGQKVDCADLLEPKSLMFMHIPLREVKYAYEESIANGKQDTENVKWLRGFDGETDKIVYCSRTDEQLFETVLEKGSTKALFYGHDHLNNFVLDYKGVMLVYGYSIDYLAYSDIDTRGYQRGCTIITCAPNGDATIVHENYYQDKYEPLYEKEIVDMEQYTTPEETTPPEVPPTLEEITIEAAGRAGDRINELINLYQQVGKTTSQGSYSADYDKMVAAIKTHTLSEGYKKAVSAITSSVTNDQLLADYELTLKLFKEELERDYAGAKNSFTEEPYKSHPEFQDEAFCFMFLEGYVAVEYAKGADGKEDKTKIEKLTPQYSTSVVTDKASAIDYVYNHKVENALNEILLYWATGTELRTQYTAKAKEVILREKGWGR